MLTRITIVAVAFAASLVAAYGGDTPSKAVKPVTPFEDPWQFKISLPGWIPSMIGESGFRGRTADIDLGPDDIIPRFDMVADVRAEAHKGRFSVMGEFLYTSLSDGIGTNSIVKKLDVKQDQAMADLGFGYRLIENSRGYLDVTAGIRYTNLYQHIRLQPNDPAIEDLAGKLAAVASAARVIKAARLLRGSDPSIPIAPLFGGQPERLRRAIEGIKGATAERKEKIADKLHRALSNSYSRTDDWWDPYIGVRGRYQFNDKFYATAKADIGGFGVGADLTWTAEVAIGFQVTPRIYNEIGYRALGVDYEDDGFTLDTVTHGPQMTLGITF